MSAVTTICSNLAPKNGTIALWDWLGLLAFADVFLFTVVGLFNLPMGLQIKDQAPFAGRRSPLNFHELQVCCGHTRALTSKSGGLFR
jgi:hypothetical protein